MDKTLRMTLLFDFYGELLTEKQREYFDLYYNDNLSLSEIAENERISRQAVRDIIVRAEAILEDTEAKTGCIARHDRLMDQIKQAEELIGEISRIVSARFKDPELLGHCGAAYDLLQEMKL